MPTRRLSRFHAVRRSSKPGFRGLVWLVAVTALLATAPARGQRTIEITGDRLSGAVFPVVPLAGNVEIRARRAWAWTVDDTKRLVLRGDIEILIAGHELSGDDAIVWINRLPTAEGPVTQVAVFMEHVENPEQASGLGVRGDRVLVTAGTRGDTDLQVDLLEQRKPPPSNLQRRGEERLAEYLRRLIGEPQQMSREPGVDKPVPPSAFVPVPGGTVKAKDYALPKAVELPRGSVRQPWLRDPDGFVTFAAQRLDVKPGETENTITATGSIVVEYYADRRTTEEFSQLTLSADRGVIFTDPGTLEEMAEWQIPADRIRGVYLEGNVVASANDGTYVVRAPRVYYDFRTGRAIMVNAILRTYTREGRQPVYARAAELRQVSDQSWEAQTARVTTSEFFTGHLSLGAERATVSQRPVDGTDATTAAAGDVETDTYVEARNISLRAGNVPFFGWPKFSGTSKDIPLRSIGIGGRANTGVIIESRWNLWTLLGNDQPPGVEADLLVDGFTRRGAGVGLDMPYDVKFGRGQLDLYGMYDVGTDRTSAGEDVVPPNEFRGVAIWEHNKRLSDTWMYQLQGAYISDATFISSWREDNFSNRREYETSGYVKWQKDRAALTLLGKYDIQDFTSNSWLLASDQYSVDRLPEITYRRYGDKLFNFLTYSTDSSYSRVRFRLEESTPNELGVPGRAFGVPNDVSIADQLMAEGYPTGAVNRFDSRHEIAAPFRVANIDVVPFGVARATWYDTDFESFSGNDDKLRFFGAIGVRASTRFQHVDNSVENQLLDLHRVRHIIEPNVTAWFGSANISGNELPVYDQTVEALGTGAVVRLGLNNTWQTQRGGPGHWRSVDVLKLDASVVFNSDDANVTSPNPQFFDYRPEYSQFGDHVFVSGVWQLSDPLSLAGQLTYDLEENETSRASVGISLQHTPDLTTFVEYREITVDDTRLLDIGWLYKLSRKYRVAVTPQYDFRSSSLRSIRLAVTRAFPDFNLAIVVKYDDIRDDLTLGASLDLVEF